MTSEYLMQFKYHTNFEFCDKIVLFYLCTDLLHSYPQLLLVLVETSLEHSVSYNDGESVPVIMYSLQLRMTCVMCWL